MKISDHLLFDGTKAVPFQQTPNQGGFVTHRYLVMHYTEGSTAAGSISWMRNPASKASAHITIARDGAITQLVRFDRVAWHAGASRWAGLNGLNQFSVGIELDNAGKMRRHGDGWLSAFGKTYADQDVLRATHKNEHAEAGWHTYTEDQLSAAAEVAATLISHYGLVDVIGHDDIAPDRKKDPGPAFRLERFRDRVMGGDSTEPEFFVTTTPLNLRQGPGAEHPKLIPTPLPVGTRVQVLARQQTWWRVDVEDTIGGEMDLQGWVHSGWLRQMTGGASVSSLVAPPSSLISLTSQPATIAPTSSQISVPQANYTVPDESDEVVARVPFAGAESVGAKYLAKFAKADQTTAKRDPSRCKTILRLRDGTIFFDAKMAVCADGSPRAKQIDNTGLTSTAHSLSDGKPFDAETIPYIVLPMPEKNSGDSFLKDMGLKKGDLAMVVYRGQRCGAILAELGPVDKIGEASIRLHELLPVPSPWATPAKERIANSSVPENVLYFVFPKTSALTAKLKLSDAEDKILVEAEKRFAQLQATA